MNYVKLKKAILSKNRAEYENRKRDMDEDLKSLRARIREMKKDKKELRADYEIDPQEVVNNLKKLKFISSMAIEGGKIRILTKDVTFDYTADNNDISGNLGPYIISFDEDLLYPEPRIARVGGPVIAGGHAYDHFFVRNNEMCMGSSGAYSQHNKFMEQGRIDLILELIWALLTLGSQNGINPYISIDHFMSLLKRQGAK